MTKNTVVTCNDCYFRRAGLCALPGDTPCPTFRAHSRGSLTPPQQPRLVARPLRTLLTAQHAAA
jgi:hypothetical protein